LLINLIDSTVNYQIMNNFTIKTSLKLLIGLVLCSLFVQAQQTGEESVSLNGSWLFKIDPDNMGEKEGWHKADASESGWENMEVPSNWDVKNRYANYGGKGWYRKTITVPENWSGKALFLKFEGVYFNSKVWLNGRLLGSNDNGFLPFEFEVSKVVRLGEKNTIVVCADNSFRLGATWNWGGIRRPVTLVANNYIRIVQQHITPSVDLNNRTADVTVKIFLQNNDSREHTVNGNVSLYGNKICNKSLNFTAVMPARSSQEVLVRTTLGKKEVHLWHFDDPFLYNCVATIESSGQLQHRSQRRFGLRKIEVDNKQYTFKLNGESVRLMGFNLVPDDRTTGNTLPTWRIKEDVDLMKETGANMARLTHFPLTDEMYDYLDERGILVFPEVSLWGNTLMVNPNDTVPKEWLKRTVFNYYNHPSIIGWSVGNEIGFNPEVMPYVASAIKLAKHLDSSRLAVMVSHTANAADDPIQYADLGLINKYVRNLKPVTTQIHNLHPEKLLFYSEFGIGQLTEDMDGNLDAKALIDSIRYLPYLMGGSLWTFNDYRSNYSGTKEYSENRPWGVVDVFRQKKKAWYAVRKEYSPVKALQVTVSNTSSATIEITPRKNLDLPAYTLHQYRLTWTVNSDSGEVEQAGFLPLQDINPGSKVINDMINWNRSEHQTSLNVQLVSPLNYAVYDTTIFFKKPSIPEIIYTTGYRNHINFLQPKSGMVRIVYKRTADATAYKAKYGMDKLVNETPATTNDYIEISGLDPGRTYQFELVALNSAGESEPTGLRRVKTEYQVPAPIIRYTEPADKGFFIGYNTQAEDYVFEVRYTNRSGDYSNANTLQSTNKGVLFVPSLENGQTYYYQIRSVKQNTFPSLWSNELSIAPDGNSPSVPVIDAVVQKGDEAELYFKPVKKAIGYFLSYREKNAVNWNTVVIDAAQIHQYHIKSLEPKKHYEFKLAAKGWNGQSGYSEVLVAKIIK
jgi:beta-galactosidase